MSQEFADRIVAARSPRKETKSLIYQHALRLFATRGYARASLREIAEAVGIEAASLYTHITSKKALLYDLMEFGNRDLLERLNKAAATAPDHALARLYALTRENVISHCRHQHQTMVVFNEIRELDPDQRTKIIAIRTEIEDLFRAELTRGMTDGTIRTIDPSITLFGILALTRGAAFWYRENGPRTPEQIGDIYADQVTRSVATTTELTRLGDTPISPTAFA